MFQYFLTIPCVKYFEYVSPFLGKIFQKLKDHTWRDLKFMNVNNFFTLISFRIIWLSFCYIHAAVEFQIFIFPFYTVAYFAINLPSIVVLFSPFIPYIAHILFGFDIFSINTFDLLTHTITDDLSGNCFSANNLKRILIYQIEPKNKMWALPFMIKRPFSIDDLCVLLLFCYLTLLVGFSSLN